MTVRQPANVTSSSDSVDCPLINLGRNPSTVYLLIFSLLTGAVGVCSVVSGLLHLRAWGSTTLASALSSALVSLSLDILAFGLARKQINLGNRGRRKNHNIAEDIGGIVRITTLQRTLEEYVIILMVTQLIYLILLHAGSISSGYGPGLRNYSTDYGVMISKQKDASSTASPIDS